MSALRANEQILRDQLTALAQAQEATTAELWVMAPMVADVEETEYFVTLAKELGIRVAGVMAEIPSLALMAEQVASASDFVSIGTNDLTQYTMAADRMMGSLAELNNPWQPAVLRMIRYTVEGARRAESEGAGRRNVGVCGEAAADPALAVVLVGLGVSEDLEGVGQQPLRLCLPRPGQLDAARLLHAPIDRGVRGGDRAGRGAGAQHRAGCGCRRGRRRASPHQVVRRYGAFQNRRRPFAGVA